MKAGWYWNNEETLICVTGCELEEYINEHRLIRCSDRLQEVLYLEQAYNFYTEKEA